MKLSIGTAGRQIFDYRRPQEFIACDNCARYNLLPGAVRRCSGSVPAWVA